MDPTSSTLGEGTYGMVKRSGNTAVKHFAKLPHLIQEYAAGAYLNNCPYTVNVLGFDLENLTLTMELYDGSLKDWLASPRSFRQKLIMFRQILKGLVWMHDLGLVHGDLKPGNCVANWSSNGDLKKVVIADLGFVAPELFAKAERTAPVYREKVVERDYQHDIYSLGVIGLEVFGNVKVTKQFSSRKLIHNVNKRVENQLLRELISQMLDEDREERPTARYILYHLFNIRPEIHYYPESHYTSTGGLDRKDKYELEDIFRYYGGQGNTIRRAKIGYYICRIYLAKKNIDLCKSKTYAGAILVILAAIFSKSKFTVKDAARLGNTSEDAVYRALYGLLNDDEVLKCLFFTKQGCRKRS